MLYRDYLKDKYQNAAVKLANAEGVPCVMEYSKGKNLRNYEIYGNSVQDGTPTPESPVEIQSVGDLTKNLLSYPYYDTTKTINGITFTDNGDGTITVDGTATADIYFFLQSNITLSSGTYIMSGCPTGGSTTTYFIGFGSSTDADIGNGAVRTLPEDRTMNLFIRILNGTAVSNIVFKPQLEEGTTATEYEPYGYKIPIVNLGKNLLSYPYNFTTRTENGLTFTDNGDGSITINGTATIQTGFMFRNQIIDAIDKAKAYVLSGGEDGNVVLRIDFYNGTTWKNLVNTGNDGKAIIDFTKMNFDYTRVSVALVVKANTVCDNITIKPQLELGETATEYEPYRVPVTANIYLDEPLRKIGDYADYIDFKNQKVIRKVKEITFENIKFNEYSYGTALDNTYHFYIRSMSCILSSSMFCNIMKAGDINMNNAVDDSFFTSRYSNQGNGAIYLQIEKSLINGYSGESNAEKLKAFLIDKNAKLLYCTTEYSEENISLPALKTFKGTNIMSVDTSIQPSNIKAKYIRT